MEDRGLGCCWIQFLRMKRLTKGTVIIKMAMDLLDTENHSCRHNDTIAVTAGITDVIVDITSITDPELEAYNSSGKFGQSFYSEDMYAREDGQLSWFNAGVRVGVGIGLGMCVGLGIGVGLLMRSYRATIWNFRRTFQ
ncbi:hypothetical protein V6N13_004953 [Hibiscus sabdariffa]